ncbi:MAG: SPOR domain-containing protein [Bacteroidota bacterium]
MDVGFYLGELLMQQGEVSVPGLGYFVQVRMSGHYDEVERKFYPPYHQAQFDVQSIDDDALAEYIAVKKNISVASAKYFSEKYITNLKQQALIGEVPIGNLGYFYTELTQLTFKPADKIIDDTIFYGFEPVSINKVGDAKPVEQRPKVELNFPPKQAPLKPAVTQELPEEVAAATAAQPTRVYSGEEEMAGVSPDFFEAGDEEEEQRKSPLMLLLVIFISVVVIALGVFALYTYKPDTFAKMVFWKHKTIVVDSIKPKPAVVSKPDTIATDSLAADSLKKDSIAAIKKDTVATTTAATTASKKTEVIVTQPVAPPKSKERIISQTEVPAPKKQVLAAVVPPKKKEVILSQTVTTPSIINKPVVTKPAAVPTGKAVAAIDRNKIQAAPSDAVGTSRFEVYAVNTASIAEANAAIAKLKRAGYKPRWVTDAGDNQYHISIGHFATREEAKKVAAAAIESGKIPGGGAYAMEVTPSGAKPNVAPANKVVPANKPVTAMDRLESNSQLLAPPSTATGTRRFEVNAFTSGSIPATNAAIRKLRSGGFDPRWVKDAAGPLYHISIGHFATKQEATDWALKAIESGKVPGGDAYPIEINPQK